MTPRAEGPIAIARETHDVAAAAAPRTRVGGSWPAVLAALSLGAALIHAAVVGDHPGLLAWLFAATAAIQSTWALAVIARPRRELLVAGLAINAVAVVAYLLSRTTGLAGLEAAEPFGTADVICAVLEVTIVVAAAYLLLPRTVLPSYRQIGPIAAGSAVVLVAMLAVPGLVATTGGHSHDAGGAHDHGAGGGHDHGAVDQVAQAEADTLVAETRRVARRWEQVADAEADGYESMRFGPIDHYVDWERVEQRGTLDPRHPESLVYVPRADGTKKLVSAMYVAPWGTTMANVPAVAGGTWHTHVDLCFDDDYHVVDYADDAGECGKGTPGTIPPMLHVSVVPNACGAFGDVTTALDAASREMMARLAEATAPFAGTALASSSATSSGETGATRRTSTAGGPGAAADASAGCDHAHHP